MNDIDKIKELEKEIVLLKELNQKLNKERVIKIRETVYPSDYKANKDNLQKLKEENQQLREYIQYGDVSTLQMTVADTIALCKVRIKKIARDYHLIDGSQTEKKAIDDLISFFEEVSSELKNWSDHTF